MDAPLLALPPPRRSTQVRVWLRRAPARLAHALPRLLVSTLLLTALFWGGYLTGTGTLEAGALPVTFVKPDGPPDWLRRFATAFCHGDAAYVAAHLGGKFDGIGEDAVRGQFDSMRASAGDCGAARYLGSLTGADGTRQYVYVFDFAAGVQRGSMWYVFTTLADTVVNIE